MSCGIDHRCGSDPALMWLWRNPVETALIPPLAWEPPYASGATQEKAKKQIKKKKIILQESNHLDFSFINNLIDTFYTSCCQNKVS